MANSDRWYTRSLTSLSVMAGFIIMSISGIVAFIVPQGRIAFWTEWTMLGLTKEQWGDIHILSSLLFVAAGIAHIYYNWRPMLAYLGQKATSGRKHKREIAITIIISVLIVGSAIWKIPPLSYLLDLNAYIKDAWVVSKEYEPPFGHAELLSLKVLTQKTNIPIEKAVAELKSKGLPVNPNQTLQEIARTNRTSPMQVYRLIRHLEVQPALAAPVTFSTEKVEEMFAGTGVGNKTLSELAEQVGLEPATLTERLAKKGLSAQADLPMKQLASKNGLQPLEVLKAALVEEYHPR